MTLLLAIDGGGTRTRCLAVDADGHVRGEGSAGPSNHLHVPFADAARALRVATSAALDSARATSADVALVSAGLAGVDVDGTGAAEAAAMLEPSGFGRLAIYGDMVIAHRGALTGEPGVIALAGTGSSVLGISAAGQCMKAGGWGPVYGDQGSAYQIGRLALTAAAEAFDGSGPPTMLVERLTIALGVPDFRHTTAQVYGDALGQQRVAALAAIVDACVEDGDEVAAAICRRAGRDLARSVSAVVHRLCEPQLSISYQGAVLRRSRTVRDAFGEALAAAGLDVRPPRFEPIAGAVWLGARALGWSVSLDSAEMTRGV